MKIKWKYEIVIYWSDADEAYITDVPELPGCTADALTYKQALAHVEVIIGEWIDLAKELNPPIPQPKGHLMYA
jgi:predicted RNase H-like HicB family nuclease